MRFCGGPVVTAAIDEMSFLQPVMLGDLVTLTASVNGVGNTSMEVGIRVETENMMTRVHKTHLDRLPPVRGARPGNPPAGAGPPACRRDARGGATDAPGGGSPGGQAGPAGSALLCRGRGS